jgi:hypothetical protein
MTAGRSREHVDWLHLSQALARKFYLVRRAVSSTFRTVQQAREARVVVKAICYKPEGRGFDTRLGEFVNLPNPSSRTRPWGLRSL